MIQGNLTGKHIIPDLTRRRSSRLQALAANQTMGRDHHQPFGKNLSFLKDSSFMDGQMMPTMQPLADSLFEAGGAY